MQPSRHQLPIVLIWFLGTLGCSSRPAPTAVYRSTPENDRQLNRFISSVLTFLVLHEMGHMVVSEYRPPVLGREEDAADRFAIAMLNPSGGLMAGPADPMGIPNATILASSAIFMHELHVLSGHDKQIKSASWADEHGLPLQRAFMITCLLYGSDPKTFTPLADNVQLLASRRQSCTEESRQNRDSWASILRAPIEDTREKAKVGVYHQPVPPAVMGPMRPILTHAKERVESYKTLEQVASYLRLLSPSTDARLRSGLKMILGGNTNEYRVVADACLAEDGRPVPNAFWQRNTRNIVLCYGMVAEVEAVGKTIIASGEFKW